MKHFVETALLAVILYIAAWFWLASLINHACKQWWTEREAYRKRLDAKVEELIDEDINEFQS
jgi:hypothetical protein